MSTKEGHSEVASYGEDHTLSTSFPPYYPEAETMSNLLWRAYHTNDVPKFRSLLGLSSGTALSNKKPFATKNRKGSTQGLSGALRKGDVNARDLDGLTILQRAVCSHAPNKLEMARALLEFQGIDLYVTDTDGWTCLHRALYFGNASVAKEILQREAKDICQSGGRSAFKNKIRLSKMKDLEGNGPWDVYKSTISRRSHEDDGADLAKTYVGGSDIEDMYDMDFEAVQRSQRRRQALKNKLWQEERFAEGDELFAFGSNKNLTLGFGDDSDRAYPERIQLKRPERLIWRLYHEYKKDHAYFDRSPVEEEAEPTFLSDLPALIRNKSIVVQDAQLSKLHSAILTTDPESNLHMCGFGVGGRLGTGDERARFGYECVEGGALHGKHVNTVALGLNHTLAIIDGGGIASWGTNTYGVLGYSLPAPKNNQEPVNSIPAQIFGPLKNETAIGVAASAIHSVAYTSTALYTWGKNEGQLGIMDADSRSLEAQPIPRRVGASLFDSEIVDVAAINKATIVLLANYSVVVFTNYGYNRVKFPKVDCRSQLRGQANTLVDSRPASIAKVAAGADTIAAISVEGDLYTLSVASKSDTTSSSSTTAPKKIKNASLTLPQKVWSLRKGNWDGVRSVGVGENGSIILCTKAGAVWRRTLRPGVKDAEAKSKDFQWQRVPGLTSVVAVRANAYGGFAAIQNDEDTPLKIEIGPSTLRQDISKLFALQNIDDDFLSPKAWELYSWKRGRSTGADIYDSPVDKMEKNHNTAEIISKHIARNTYGPEYDVRLGTNTSEVEIPVHAFVLGARSLVLRESIFQAINGCGFTIPDLLTITRDGSTIKVVFHDVEVEALYNLAMYAYTDSIMETWNCAWLNASPVQAKTWKNARVEVMTLARKLEMKTLEHAARIQSSVPKIMPLDYQVAVRDPHFLDCGDAMAELDGDEITVYSSLMRVRCPFFEQLFGGRSGGQWLHVRRQESDVVRVDLTHVKPHIFTYVLQYLYSDCGAEMFDSVVAADLDEFSHVIMDVLNVADELMLDRLGQICQSVLGRFVNTRNIAYLLNEVEPLAIKGFKDKGLEYVALQLESILDTHGLDDLDEDILMDVDAECQRLQIECLPYTFTNVQLQRLMYTYPESEGEIAEDRERLLRDMDFRAQLKAERNNHNFRRGSLEATFTPSKPAAERPSSSSGPMMFDMDADDSKTVYTASPFARVKYGDAIPFKPTLTPRLSQRTLRRLGKGKGPLDEDTQHQPVPSPLGTPASASPKVWSSPVQQSLKVDMKDIFSAELSTPRIPQPALSDHTSSLSMEIHAQRATAAAEAIARTAMPKMSQKERKRLALERAEAEKNAAEAAKMAEKEEKKAEGPWQVSKGEKVKLADVGKAIVMPSAAGGEIDALNKDMAKTKAASIPRRTGSPDTRFSGQKSSSPAPPTPANSRGFAISQDSKPVIPVSKVYDTRDESDIYDKLIRDGKGPEAALQLSMQEIIDQQRWEAQVLREAGKRSLAEIQEEQRFQEWWDNEAKKLKEEEEAHIAKFTGRGKKEGKKGGKNNVKKERGESKRDEGGPSAQDAEASKDVKSRESKTRRPDAHEAESLKDGKTSDPKPSRAHRQPPNRKASTEVNDTRPPRDDPHAGRGGRKPRVRGGCTASISRDAPFATELRPRQKSSTPHPLIATSSAAAPKAAAPALKPDVPEFRPAGFKADVRAFVPGQGLTK